MRHFLTHCVEIWISTDQTDFQMQRENEIHFQVCLVGSVVFIRSRQNWLWSAASFHYLGLCSSPRAFEQVELGGYIVPLLLTRNLGFCVSSKGLLCVVSLYGQQEIRSTCSNRNSNGRWDSLDKIDPMALCLSYIRRINWSVYRTRLQNPKSFGTVGEERQRFLLQLL